MSVRNNLTGKRFGYLTVIGISLERHGNKLSWDVKCDCGTRKVLNTSVLTCGNTRSCGCYRRDLHKKRLFKGEGVSGLNRIYYEMKRKCPSRGLEFSLTLEDLKGIIVKNCYYCGVEPRQKSTNSYGRSLLLYNGVDRYDNTKGYILENCVPCCIICNRMKRDLGITEFRDHIQQIHSHFLMKNDWDGKA